MLRWFRRPKPSTDERARVQDAPPAPTQTVTPPPAEAGATDPARKKRRRGSRGGRGRKRTGAAGTQTQAKAKAETADAKPEAKKTEARPERRPAARKQRAPRRRTPARRPPLPPAKRELLISVDVSEQRVAVLEDDKVAEAYLERPERRSIAGNIYKGTVDNVLPGMEAAFIEIGLEKNGFLYVDEVIAPELEGKSRGRKIQDLLSRGQEVMVQAVKDPMKSKGARLTTEISLPGRFVVFVPHGEGLGVSRRLEDDERVRLRDILKRLDVKKGGVIIRTAAEGASAEDIERDLVFLQRLWRTIEAQAKAAKAPSLVYQEAELPLRVIRDLFTEDFERALVDHERTYKRVVGYLKKTSPHMADRVDPPPREDAADGGLGRRCRDPLDALAPGRPAFRRLPRLRLRGGVHGDRRQHRPLRRWAGEIIRRAAGGHDHQEQPRGRQGGRAPAAAARHRRHHRHRLHRHGEPEEPGDRRGGAEDRARARPDEDLRGRDLAARAGRDDAAERDRRAARDPHAQVHRLRRRRGRPLGGLGRGGRRAAPARAGHERSPYEGVQGRAALAGREHPDRPRRITADGDRGGDEAALRVRLARRRARQPLRGARQGHRSRASWARARPRRASRSS